jgi:hypothetical protein
MTIILQNMWLWFETKFDYDVRLDAKNLKFYYNMGHIWFQYQYLIQKTMLNLFN